MTMTKMMRNNENDNNIESRECENENRMRVRKKYKRKIVGVCRRKRVVTITEQSECAW